MWEDQYAQKPADKSMTGMNVSFTEADRHIVQNIIKEAETLGTNNSLMVYTSSVNCTNIEDRTMSNETKLKEVSKEIVELRDKLENEVAKHDDVLITAEVGSWINMPENNAPFLSEEWERMCRHRDNIAKQINTGIRLEGMQVRLSRIGGRGTIAMTDSLDNAIHQFKTRITKEYRRPLADLLRKQDSLRTLAEAENTVARMERKIKTKEVVFSVFDEDDDEEFFF